LRAKTAKAIVRLYFDQLLNAKDLSICDDFLAATYRDHDAPPETPPGPDSVKAFVGQFLKDYPDLQVQIEALLAEGSKVAVRLTWHGTHRESGAKLHQMGIIILRLNEGGQLVERWSAYKAL
jgi:predicted SnoaL-like aldol condensation-catalyzing enzyme